MGKVTTVYDYTLLGWSRAYPRFKKWGTNHGEREEQGAEGAEGSGVWEGVTPLHRERGLVGGYAVSPENC